jgi:hypothetical protein
MQNEVYLNHEPNIGIKKSIEFYLTNETKELDESIFILFTGELYNCRELCKTLMIDYISQEHTIKSIYQVYGIDETIKLLDGTFTFILLDHNIYSETANLYIVRDVIGIIPIYIHIIPFGIASVLLQNNPSILSSRLQAMDNMQKDIYDKIIISKENTYSPNPRTCRPGSYISYSLDFCVNAKWKFSCEKQISTLSSIPIIHYNPILEYYSRIFANLFEISILKRIENTENIICIIDKSDIYSKYMVNLTQNIIHKRQSIYICNTITEGIDYMTDKNHIVLHSGYIDNIFQIKEKNPAIQNRVIRDHIENNNLYDIWRLFQNKESGNITFPFWDITFIQFYMTIPANYREEIIRKTFF